MATSFLITGASGNVGQAVVNFLPLLEGDRLYRATHQTPPGAANERWLDFQKPESYTTALAGIDVVFLLRPPQLADVDTYFKPFIDACRQSQIKHLVFLSVQGVENMPYIPHAKIERLIERSGLSYTFIRPAYFMQNLTTTLRDDIVQRQRLFLPAGNARFLWVDAEDVGRATAQVLQNWTDHKNQSYTITGQDLVDFGTVSHWLSEQLGRLIRYESPNWLRFLWIKRRAGVSTGMILIMLMLHILPRFQRPPRISDDYQQLTGHSPQTLRRFIAEHQTDWQ